jgi:hypothetical protein
VYWGLENNYKCRAINDPGNRASLPGRYALCSRWGSGMNGRERLLRRVALKCADFARQLSYHRALAEYRGSFTQNFWIYMHNNAIDLAVLDWFHLFGSHKDHLHWKQVVTDVPAFRNQLFQSLQITEDEWKTYRESIKAYRDKDVAHIEVRPFVSQVPDMALALKAAALYYSTVRAELSTFRDYGGWPSELEEYHIRSLEQSKAICAVAYGGSRDIEEGVS